MPTFLAIDPGLTGAVAIYDPTQPAAVVVHDMPTVAGEVDPAELSRLVREAAPILAAVERVNAMPGGGQRKMGATSAFNFGGAYAVARTSVQLSGVPLHLVTPQTWKKHFRLPGGDEAKEAARAMALRLFPASAASFARKMDHGRAEAALLARYAAQHLKP